MPEIDAAVVSVEKTAAAIALLTATAELMHQLQAILIDHHPEDALIEDCDICMDWRDRLIAAMDQLEAAQRTALEEWEILLDA